MARRSKDDSREHEVPRDDDAPAFARWLPAATAALWIGFLVQIARLAY